MHVIITRLAIIFTLNIYNSIYIRETKLYIFTYHNCKQLQQKWWKDNVWTCTLYALQLLGQDSHLMQHTVHIRTYPKIFIHQECFLSTNPYLTLLCISQKQLSEKKSIAQRHTHTYLHYIVHTCVCTYVHVYECIITHNNHIIWHTMLLCT